jgi:hypothetical protein
MVSKTILQYNGTKQFRHFLLLATLSNKSCCIKEIHTIEEGSNLEQNGLLGKTNIEYP